MSVPKEHKDIVTNYYRKAQPFYSLLWHRSSLGLHYGFWDGTVSDRVGAITRENEVLANLVDIKPDEIVLDAGCGIGGSGLWLARERGARVLGLNLTPTQLITARSIAAKRRGGPDLGFVVGDYQQLPIPNSSIDIYWSLESIEHTTDPERMIEEAYRVLKPKGRMVVAGTLKGRDLLKPQEVEQLQVGMDVAGCFSQLRTADEIRQIMENSGFVNVKSYDYTGYVMESSRQMAKMCKWGLPMARLLASMHLVDPVLVKNNQWGLYQEGLFRSGATSYNVLTGLKP
jgi:tocopherol O-methyltransferase